VTLKADAVDENNQINENNRTTQFTLALKQEKK